MALQSQFSRLFALRASVVVIRALLKLKIRAKNAVLDPVHSWKIDLRREEMFRCLSSLLSVSEHNGLVLSILRFCFIHNHLLHLLFLFMVCIDLIAPITSLLYSIVLVSSKSADFSWKVSRLCLFPHIIYHIIYCKTGPRSCGSYELVL